MGGRPQQHGTARGFPGRRPRDADRTRHEILLAAGRRFARRDFSRVTLKEIADDVGVTPPLVVRYFGSKLALFDEVAKGDVLDLAPLTDDDHWPQLLARAREVLEYYQDDARAAGIALLRSLDLDGGELFRSELERRMQQPWSSEVTGPDAAIRLKLIPGVLLGVGLFSLGALIEPDRPPLNRADADTSVHYLAALLAVCLDHR